MEYWENDGSPLLRFYHRHWPALLLLLLSLVLFFAGNSRLLITDPVESNYALTAREMLAAGDWLSPRIYGNFWYDKPWLFYGELLVAFHWFGETSFAARFFPSLFGVIGVLQTYWFAQKLYNRKIGFLSGLIMATSVEYFYLAKAVITDMTLFVAMDGALMLFYVAKTGQRTRLYYGAYLLAGLAILTKGPIGLVLPGLIILAYLLGNRDSHTLFHMKLCRGLLLSLSIAALWYGPMVQLHGSAFLKGFIGVHNILRATVSEHPRNNTWWYYFLIFLIGCFPWSLSLPWLWKRYGKTLQLRFRRHTFWQSLDDRQRFLFLWVFVTWLFFECMATKYPTYTFPCLPPLAIGLAASLDTLQAEYWAKRLAAGLALVFLVLSHTVAVPLCRQASAWDAAQLIRVYRLPSVPVYVYGGRYPVSFTWYSGIPAPRLVTRERLAEMRPEGISWNAKNMMPFAALEDLPNTGKIMVLVDQSSQKDFLQTVPGNWEKLGEGGRWTVWGRN
ncbi:MAG: glycosyltransferase family 39 protein [Acidaminococcus fermentans]|uniref:ArnT family glycosyltransferase n=1 Tax=Acidaminococcus fermentans TaxID=905 RepID=UPI00243100F0|nr:glycosyltransferase family 39 protein [Acidaminococcus fermentans]MCF0140235.1 glycosyltransferase family 39 protein [Acidaminococcus fermentans]